MFAPSLGQFFDTLEHIVLSIKEGLKISKKMQGWD
jgi:hypothetical protein